MQNGGLVSINIIQRDFKEGRWAAYIKQCITQKTSEYKLAIDKGRLWIRRCLVTKILTNFPMTLWTKPKLFKINPHIFLKEIIKYGVYILKDFDGQGDKFQPFAHRRLITSKDVTPFHHQRMQSKWNKRQNLILPFFHFISLYETG